MLKLTEGENTQHLSDFRGDYVLLSFWNSQDAPSRVDVNKYAWEVNAICDSTEVPLKHVGVNFDEDDQMFEHIVRRDRLDSTTQFNVQGQNAEKIQKDYNLNGRYGSILLDPEGKVVAVNPTHDQLREVANNQIFQSNPNSALVAKPIRRKSTLMDLARK